MNVLQFRNALLEVLVQGISPNGIPVSGVLSATTTGAALGGSLPCKGVLVFPSDAEADTYIGDASLQPSRIPGIGVFVPTSNVALVFGKLSTGTGNISWIAIT